MKYDEFIDRYEYELSTYFAETGQDREYDFDEERQCEIIYDTFVELDTGNIYDCFWK